MNRTELLELVFGQPEEELPVPKDWFLYREQDDENPNVWHVRSIVGLGQHRVLVRRSVSPGDAIMVAATTIPVATIMNVCTDPDHRGKGYASDQMKAAHGRARSWTLTDYAAVFAGPEFAGFYARLGYTHPVGAPEGFMVYPLGGEPWPEGQVDPRGRW